MPNEPETGVERALREQREATVTYTVRDLLFRIEERMIRVEDRSAHYATKADVEAASVKYNERYRELAKTHEDQYNKLAQELDELKSVRDKFLGYLAAVATIGALSGGTAGYFINFLTPP